MERQMVREGSLVKDMASSYRSSIFQDSSNNARRRNKRNTKLARK